MITLNPESRTPLVTQIVDGFRQLITEQTLRGGAKLPSIRALAAAHSISVFTVVEAYDRLVAQGWVVSRSNAGFFVKRRATDAAAPAQAEPESADLRFDARWYLRHIFESRNLELKPGCGWLPNGWLFEEGVRRSLRQLASEGVELGGYGLPHGHMALRVLIAESLAEREVTATAGQILLTQGSSQAFDLVAHRPKVFFTQPRLQSPTNSVAPVAQLFQLLKLADQHGLTVVENDIYADLDPEQRPSLASLDQLRRVVYVGSYSKTISPNIRVGYLAARGELLEDLAQLKMVSGLTSSDITERLAFGALCEGRWRKHLKSLRDRLAQAHEGVARRLTELGFELFSEPKAGMYLWARHPDLTDCIELSQQAATMGILLGPGHLFLAEPRPTGWLRFNVAFSDDERLYRFLDQQIRLHHPGAAA